MEIFDCDYAYIIQIINLEICNMPGMLCVCVRWSLLRSTVVTRWSPSKGYGHNGFGVSGWWPDVGRRSTVARWTRRLAAHTFIWYKADVCSTSNFRLFHVTQKLTRWSKHWSVIWIHYRHYEFETLVGAIATCRFFDFRPSGSSDQKYDQSSRHRITITPSLSCRYNFIGWTHARFQYPIF